MKITRLVLSDFGKFHQEEFKLAPGLNIATGANESGKTTLRMFIRSMFYGLERERGIRARRDDYTRYKPWDYGRFQGILEFEAEGKCYRLFRNFLSMQKEVRLTELSAGREIEDVDKFLRKLGLKSEAVYTNTFWIGNNCSTEDLLAVELKDFLANAAYNGGTGLNLQKSLDWLLAQKKELMKQMPEKELAACMEELLKKEEYKDRQEHIRQTLDGYLLRQKELEAAIKEKKSSLEQAALERKQEEVKERQKLKGERLLILFCILAAIFAGAAFFIPTLLFKLVAFGTGLILLTCGPVLGFPRIKRGRLAALRRKELEQQLELNSGQLETCYEELTSLLPKMEQERFLMEQTEEWLKHCEILEEQYKELKHQQQELEKSVEAVNLAYVTLDRLSAELYEEFGAKFAGALSGYSGAFTDQAYQILTADDDLVLRAVTGERSLGISDVSFGTGEQFYLALRFAAADVFDPEKKNPVILDDSFAAFDDQRLESAVLTLAKCGRQILLLSSTGREEAAAKRMGITYEAVF